MLEALYRPLLRRLFSHIPPEQLLRFLLVGVWNTVFGYSSFAALTYALSFRWPHNGYIAAGLLASVLNISVAFLGYKKFVFKTKGNYFEEWLRCMVVRGTGVAIGSRSAPVRRIRHPPYHCDRSASSLHRSGPVDLFHHRLQFSGEQEVFVSGEN